MSLDREHKDADPITSVDPLLAYFRSAERPAPERRVGLEHEKLIYPAGGAAPVPYEGATGIGALLDAIQPLGYRPFREPGRSEVIALERGRETISLEPGGQLELSGSPFPTAREAHAENERHVAELRKAGASLGLYPVALGYRPFGTVAEAPWMPKERYRVMREVLSRRGPYALDMMLMTCTGQVSLDWESEADLAAKMTLIARASPLLVALYANSPLVQGRPSGYLSYRSHVWTGVDAARCGYFPAMVDGTFSYRAYVEWALDAPLLFLRRDGRYLQPKLTFRELLRTGFEGGPAFLSDWTDHLSTLFPEVRIKRVLEVRGADCVSLPLTGALVGLLRGLLYDARALADATALVPKLSYQRHLALWDAAARQGLRAELAGRPLSGWAAELVAIASEGLKRLDPADVPLLEPLTELAASGRSPADEVLAAHARAASPGELLARFAA